MTSAGELKRQKRRERHTENRFSVTLFHLHVYRLETGRILHFNKIRRCTSRIALPIVSRTHDNAYHISPVLTAQST